MTKVFLAIVGATYLLLAIWCAVLPAKTSQAIGFDVTPGSGQSEYLVIYGGLQLALGLVFIWPLFKNDAITSSLSVCVLVHGCIVLFRTISFFRYSEIGSMTNILAVMEWVIFLTAAYLLWQMRRVLAPVG